jgi:CHAT domain-containing protein/tetratricopeptide (TPR) repeat protein
MGTPPKCGIFPRAWTLMRWDSVPAKRRVLTLVGALLIAVTAQAGCQSTLSEPQTSPSKRYGLSASDMNEAVRRGESRQALAFYSAEAERLLMSGQTDSGVLALTRAMSVAYRTGELDQGLRLAARAQDVLATSPAGTISGNTRSNVADLIGTVNRISGRVDEAQRVYEQGLVEAYNDFFRGLFSRQLGQLSKDRGDGPGARAYLRRAVDSFEIQIARERGTPNVSARQELSRSLRLLATLLPPEEAEPLVKQALALAKWLGYPEEEIWALYSLATLKLDRHELDDAEKRFREALVIATRVGHEDSLMWVHAGLGRTYRAQGRLDEALREYERALGVVEGVRARFQRAAGRSDFVDTRQGLYREAVVTALQAGQLGEAFAFAERSRARAFLDLLGTQTSVARARQPELAETEARILANLNSVAEGSASGEDPATRAAMRDAAVREFDRFVSRVRIADPEQASLLTVAPISADEVKGLLPPNTALVEFMVMARRTVVWILHRDSIEIVDIYVSRADLVDRTRAFRQAIADRAPVEVVAMQAQALYALLFQKVSERLRAERVILAPHDVLHYLPFGALRTKEGRWLVENLTLTTVPSASVLRYLNVKGANAAGRTLAVGNPDLGPDFSLRFAELEARMVVGRDRDAVLLVRGDATKSNVKALIAGAGIVHFATHAELRGDDPLASALLLSPEAGDSGRLEVHEILKLDLNARLVVLSACETGLGGLTQGDELVGLQRAFLYAGTRSVVTTLWKVDDRATYDLMQAFYSQLATQGAADALRAAQRTTLAQYPHPFAWAAFGLTGLPR